MRVEDLDEDGSEEVVFRERHSRYQLFWLDVYQWSGYGLVKANEKFPHFFEKKIRDYYQSNIDNTRSRFPSASDGYRAGRIEANEELIERARGIVQANPPFLVSENWLPVNLDEKYQDIREIDFPNRLYLTRAALNDFVRLNDGKWKWEPPGLNIWERANSERVN